MNIPGFFVGVGVYGFVVGLAETIKRENNAMNKSKNMKNIEDKIVSFECIKRKKSVKNNCKVFHVMLWCLSQI